MKTVSDEFRWCEPNKYHPSSVKLILISEGYCVVAHISVLEIHHPMFSIQKIREQMELYTQRKKERNFEYNGFWVEIHYNVYYNKFFWTTGKSKERFEGPCLYFERPDLAITDAKKNLDLMTKSHSPLTSEETREVLYVLQTTKN